MAKKTEEERIKEINERWSKRPAYDTERARKNRLINRSLSGGSTYYNDGWMGNQYKSIRG